MLYITIFFKAKKQTKTTAKKSKSKKVEESLDSENSQETSSSGQHPYIAIREGKEIGMFYLR